MTDALNGPHRKAGRKALAIGLSLAAFVAVAMIWLDVPVAGWVHRHAFADATKLALQLFRAPGNYLFTVFLAVLLLTLRRCRLRAVLLLLIVGAVASAVTAILKWCCGRIRPFHGRAAFDWVPFANSPFDTLSTRNLSFPSGDSTLAFATAAVLMRIEPQLGTVGFAWAIIVGTARVLQGAHYVSDVTAGALVGGLTAEILTRLLPVKSACDLLPHDSQPSVNA